MAIEIFKKKCFGSFNFNVAFWLYMAQRQVVLLCGKKEREGCSTPQYKSPCRSTNPSRSLEQFARCHLPPPPPPQICISIFVFFSPESSLVCFVALRFLWLVVVKVFYKIDMVILLCPRRRRRRRTKS